MKRILHRRIAASAVAVLCASTLSAPLLAAGPPEVATPHPAPPPPPAPTPPPPVVETPYSAQNIGNPYSSYNLSHPESPTSALNLSNPANPASPSSPLNPSNQPYSGENIANPYSTYNLQHPESPNSALNINNPNNIASPNNPLNIQRRQQEKREDEARSQRDDGPRYRSGFLSAFEGENPVVVYREGAAEQECRIGIDCPTSVYAALGRPAPDDAMPTPSPRRHATHRHRRREAED